MDRLPELEGDTCKDEGQFSVVDQNLCSFSIINW